MDAEYKKLLEENKRLKKELEKLTQSKSDINYELAFRQNASVMLLIIPETGQIIDANNKALEFYGYSLEQIKNININDINLATKKEIEEELINAKKSNRNYFLFKHKVANNKIANVEIYSGLINDSHDKFLNSVIHEVTDKSHIAQALKESENRLNTFINSIPDIVCYKDGKGRWLLANDADLELFCLQNVAYVGKTDAELAPFTNEIYKDAFLNCMKTDEVAWQNGVLTKEIEHIPTIDGQTKVYDVIKIPLFNPDKSRKGLAVIGRDITDIDYIQNRLIEAKEKAEQSNLLKPVLSTICLMKFVLL